MAVQIVVEVDLVAIVVVAVVVVVDLQGSFQPSVVLRAEIKLLSLTF